MSETIAEGFRILQENANDLYLRDSVSEIEGPPEPLDFYRDWVSANVPVIFRNAARHFSAFSKWNQQYLREKIGSQLVTVAVTPNGWADAMSDDGHFFMLPEEKKMHFSEFLDRLDDRDENNPVHYMQQQNSNLTSEMSALLDDVPGEIDWATKAFGQKPDAANFWLGDKRAITSTHKDPYENIYCVIRGEKTFVLSPPTDLPGMNYKTLPIAKFDEVRSTKDYRIVPSEDNATVRWICPGDAESKEKLPIRPKKLVARVREGDMLYLPALWFHQVSQSHGCIAVNYWYDMRFDIKYAYFAMLEHLCAPQKL